MISIESTRWYVKHEFKSKGWKVLWSGLDVWMWLVTMWIKPIANKLSSAIAADKARNSILSSATKTQLIGLQNEIEKQKNMIDEKWIHKNNDDKKYYRKLDLLEKLLNKKLL